jgi:hypothetical protein
MKLKNKLLISLIGIIFIAIIVFIINKASNVYHNVLNKNTNQSSETSKNDAASNDKTTNNEKYQCYIKLNNDVVNCYEIAINPYLKDKGTKEIIEDRREPEKVQINPMIKSNYEQLEKVRAAINQKPKMDIDQDATKLADAAEKVYDLINEIYYCYGSPEYEEYGKKTDKTKEELHKEFLSSTSELSSIYKNFDIKLQKMAIDYMSMDLKKYKDNNDMDSYHTLNIIIEAEKVYQYFVDNNITNENLFNMNLEEYNKILKEYNEAYADFEKQDIKGATVHTTSFRDFQKAYHSFANNIVNMVNEKNYKSGKLDGPKGLVSPSDDEDIQERLYFYIDRLTSDYNSIQSFKK